jgi:hypothetical protein
MSVPTSEVGYTSVTTGRGDHEVHKGHMVALERRDYKTSDDILFYLEIYPVVKKIQNYKNVQHVRRMDIHRPLHFKYEISTCEKRRQRRNLKRLLGR